MSYRPVVEVVRAITVESVHYGAVAVSDPTGTQLGSWGTPDEPVYLRSAAKPFQALSLLETGAADAFGLTPQQIAVVCGSHGGTDRHVEVLQSLHRAVGVGEGDLQCGVHPPLDKATAERIIQEGGQLSPIRHNCSGKHTGMLATSRFLGAPIDDYLSPDHPVQQRILSGVREIFDLQNGKLVLGTDGCSAPIFAAPLKSIAKAYARLADPDGFSETRQDACRQIWGAMTGYPFVVAGDDRFDTLLMEAGEGEILAKGGAEGVQAVAIHPDAFGKRHPGIGIAIKISDGDPNARARPIVTLEVLRQLDLVPSPLLMALEDHTRKQIDNWRGNKVGIMRPCFTLG